MNKKNSKRLLSNFSVEIGLFTLLLLLPLGNIYASYSCDLDPDYSPDYTYVYTIIILIIIVYAVVMLVLSHIFIKGRILLLKALLLFLILLFLFFLNIIFSAIPAIVTTVVLSIILIWILSYISVKNKVLFLKAFITLIALFVILSVTNYFDRNKGKLKDFNISIECKKSGGVLRKGACGTGHDYCSFLTIDHGKICYDDNDCEEYCKIENVKEIKKIWDRNYPDNYIPEKYEPYHLDYYLDVEKNDWISKTGIEIEGKCSEFKGETRDRICGYIFEEIWVKNNIVKRKHRCYSF